MKKYLCVSNRTLLLIAGIVWLIAGFNVARLGIISYGMIDFRWFYIPLSILVFAAFGTMFFKMTVKHTRRIMSYTEKKPFWYFFDIKSYIIMACMMSGGIGFRAAGVFPDVFVAFFYSGLGFALALAGVVFLIRFWGGMKSGETMPSDTGK